MPRLKRLDCDQLLSLFLGIDNPPTKQAMANLETNPETSSLLRDLMSFLDDENCHGIVVYQNHLLDSSSAGHKAYVGFGNPPRFTCRTAKQLVAKYPVVSVDGRPILASNRGLPEYLYRKKTADDYVPEEAEQDEEYVEAPHDYVAWKCGLCNCIRSAMVQETEIHGPPTCPNCEGPEGQPVEMFRQSDTN